MGPAGSGDEGHHAPDPTVDRLARQGASVVALVFAALLLTVGALMILATASLAPDGVTLGLVAAWLGTAGLTWRVRRRPVAVLVVPVLLTLAVSALTAIGTTNLGWS